MSSLESLLAPISADQVCGEDMGFSPEFDAIADMRREDDPTLAQGEWVTELKVADWPGVVKTCEDLLRTRTKDLRVVGWWADAVTRLRGFAGLADGLNLTAALVRDHWETVHPMPEGGDMEERVGAMSWLLHRVEALCGMAPVVTVGRRKLGLRDVEGARARGSDAPPPDGGSEPMPTLEAIHRAMAQGGSTGYEQQLQDANNALAALAEMQKQVDARLGLDGPGFSGARKTLDSALDGLRRLGRDSGLGTGDGLEDEPTAAHEGTAPMMGQGAPAAGGARGPLQTRSQALQQLRDVAAYFRRTEPHSPVAYLAEKAARWGDLPLHAWLRQVVKDDASLARLDELLGMEPPEPR